MQGEGQQVYIPESGRGLRTSSGWLGLSTIGSEEQWEMLWASPGAGLC